MISKHLIIIIILASFGSCAGAGPSVECVDYRGWSGSYRMSAGRYSLVVVPAIGGRIMEYSLDGRNVIWENAVEFGKVYEITNDWRNYGGYKTWVSPQDYWHWPPDPILDRGKANVEVFDRDGRKWLRIIGQPSLKSGVMFIKELTLDENGEVTLIQKMRAVGKPPTKWGIHDVTQVKTPCFVVFPIRSDTRVPGGIRYLFGDPKKTAQFTVRDGLCITSYHGQVYQIGAESDGPWMIWFQDDMAYVKLFPPMKRDAEYGDRGSSAVVFTSDGKLGYLEMEILGPLIDLSDGEETELIERWRLFRLDEHVKSPYSIKRIIREMERKGLIPSRG